MRVLIVLLGLAAGAAQADDERFEKLDFDRDGKVSKAEAAGNADLIIGFDRADRNRDGKLTRAEYERLLARAEAQAAAKSAAADKAAAKSAAADKAAAKSAGTGSTSPAKAKKKD